MNVELAGFLMAVFFIAGLIMGTTGGQKPAEPNQIIVPSCAVCNRPGIVYYGFMPIEWEGMNLRVNFYLCEEHRVNILTGSRGAKYGI